MVRIVLFIACSINEDCDTHSERIEAKAPLVGIEYENSLSNT